MKRHILTAAFMMSCLLASVGSFAAEKGRVHGRASMEQIGSSNQYNLKCNDGRMICYIEYTNGDLAVNYRDNVILCHLPQSSNPPVLRPDPLDPGNYIMDGSIIVELNPDQQPLLLVP